MNPTIVEQTTGASLHHPRPARPSTSRPSGPLNALPGIQYSTTPVQRPPAPAPASPDVRTLQHVQNAPQNGYTYHAHNSEANVWKSQPAIPIPDRYNSTGSTSPTVTRRSARSGSSDSTSPTRDEHGIQYPELNRITVQPAVLRQRSASSPEHLKPIGAAYAVLGEGIPIAAPAIKPRANRTNTGTVHFTPDNLFVSLTGKNVLKIYNLTPSNNGPNAIMEAVRREVLATWPAGVKLDDEGRGQWAVHFNREIWCQRGQDGVIARKMIVTLFSTLAAHGYAYLCSIENTSVLRAPRHLFTSSPPLETHFFSLSFSLRKNKLSLIGCPIDLNVAISNALKNATLFDVEEIEEDVSSSHAAVSPNNDEEEEEEADSVCTYRLTKRSSVSRSKKDVVLFLRRTVKADMLLLLSQLLKIIASFGYRLDASVPLGKVGLFGLGGRREVWIFKAVSWKK